MSDRALLIGQTRWRGTFQVRRNIGLPEYWPPAPARLRIGIDFARPSRTVVGRRLHRAAMKEGGLQKRSTAGAPRRASLPPEQLFYVAVLELHPGRAAVIALAAMGGDFHLAKQGVHFGD